MLHLGPLRRRSLAGRLSLVAKWLSIGVGRVLIAAGRLTLFESLDLSRLNALDVLTANVYATKFCSEHIFRRVLARLCLQLLRLLHRLLPQTVAGKLGSVDGKVGVRSNLEQLDSRVVGLGILF